MRNLPCYVHNRGDFRAFSRQAGPEGCKPTLPTQTPPARQLEQSLLACVVDKFEICNLVIVEIVGNDANRILTIHGVARIK